MNGTKKRISVIQSISYFFVNKISSYCSQPRRWDVICSVGNIAHNYAFTEWMHNWTSWVLPHRVCVYLSVNIFLAYRPKRLQVLIVITRNCPYWMFWTYFWNGAPQAKHNPKAYPFAKLFKIINSIIILAVHWSLQSYVNFQGILLFVYDNSL